VKRRSYTRAYIGLGSKNLPTHGVEVKWDEKVSDYLVPLLLDCKVRWPSAENVFDHLHHGIALLQQNVIYLKAVKGKAK